MAENDRTQANRLIRECQETQNPYLDLGNCGITDLGDLPELFECTHLQTLILANEWWDWQKRKWMQSANSGLKNQLTSLSPAIISLKKLSLFNLSGKLYNFYQISDIQFLEKLTGLQTLDLSYNRISDIQFLEKLTGLKTLDLSDNQISDIRFLEKLTGLKTLDLSSNQISDIRFLEKLTGLQSLDLSYNKISDYRFLEKLTELQALYLHSNQISDYRFLEKLT
ncbi:leucine-rich repeat domain-containing protein, partial [candidate division KSB1 bacterium]|nr:leucine-rich repeat domain-containing protein [candidate division KSB1 bacterium]